MNLFCRLLFACLVPLILPAAASGASAPPDFTFIQASDVHTPMPESKSTIATIRGLGAVDLAPFGVTVPRPSFAIVSGDLTEFGGGNGWWAEYMDYWRECGIPVFSQLGNHDNTWHANLKFLRDAGFGFAYSFDRNGCHFIGLMTATLQDPRPSVPEEQILWLRNDLKRTGAATPVFVFFHHPLPGSEFASRYDYDRLLDTLHEANTVLLMAGHSHGHVYRSVDGLDQITGGSTFGRNAGLTVVSVQSNILRAAYWSSGQTQPELKLLEKPIPAKAAWPGVTVTAPRFRSSTGPLMTVSAELEGVEGIEQAGYTVDDELHGNLDLVRKAARFCASGSVEVGGVLPGAHYLRVDFIKGGRPYSRSTEFFYDPPGGPTAWRAYLAASSKATPTVADEIVYAGANDGRLRAFRADDGQELWSADTGAEILAQPLVWKEGVCVANGLGKVVAFSRSGERLWSFAAPDAVYSSPVQAEGRIFFGCNDGGLYALQATNGTAIWTNRDADYAIESPPFVARSRVYFGAWDGQVRCVNARDGRLVWKRASEGVRKANAAKRYFSPADAAPVVAEGNLMIADRAYYLTILDAVTGELVGSLPRVAATGLSQDGRFVYLRRTDGSLTKVDSAGKELWSAAVKLNALPVAPTEHNGVVYVASATGLVSAVAADTGKIRWQYQASPRLFVMSAIACDGASAYVTAFDGSLTAIRCR